MGASPGFRRRKRRLPRRNGAIYALMDLVRWKGPIEQVPHPSEQVGTGPRLGEERQRGIERVFAAPRPGIATGEEERRRPPFAAVDLIEAVPTEARHHEIGEHEVDRLRVLAQQVQRFDA